MARRNDFGKALLIGVAAAVAGGVLAYLRRRELEGMVQDIADAVDARKEEDGFFSADLEGKPIFHKVPTNGESAPEEAPEEVPAEAVSEEAPAVEEAPEEAPVAEEAPEEAPAAEEVPGTAD